MILVPLSDVHYGNPLFSASHYDHSLQYIEKTPNAYGLLNGDLCEAIIRSSVGDIYSQTMSPEKQRDYHIDKLTPIKKKLLGATCGNHEWRIANLTGIDIMKDIAKALSIPYRPEGLLLKISFGSGNSRHPENPYTYFVYMTHGYGGARTKAAKSIKVERLGTWIHADCYIMSHDHVVNVAPDVYLMPDPRTHTDPDTGFQVGQLKAHRKMLVKSGAMLRWGGYSEMGGFPPVDMTQVIVKLAGTGKPRVTVEV